MTLVIRPCLVRIRSENTLSCAHLYLTRQNRLGYSVSGCVSSSFGQEPIISAADGNS